MATLASPRIVFRQGLWLACGVGRLLLTLPAVAQAQLIGTTNRGAISHKDQSYDCRRNQIEISCVVTSTGLEHSCIVSGLSAEREGIAIHI